MEKKESGLWAGIKDLIARAKTDEFGEVEYDVQFWSEDLREFSERTAGAKFWRHGNENDAYSLPEFELPERTKTLEVVGRAVGQWAIEKLHSVGLIRLDSQIEELMLYGLVFGAWSRGLSVLVVSPDMSQARLCVGNNYVECRIEVHPKVAGLKPDFVVGVTDPACWGESSSARMAIECDGHDFHEKTKQQAARDKKRDRTLMAAGASVLRFAGSEIYADPIKQGIWVVDTLQQTLLRTRFEEIFRAEGRPRFLKAVDYVWFERSTGRTIKEWADAMGFEMPPGKK